MRAVSNGLILVFAEADVRPEQAVVLHTPDLLEGWPR